MLQAGRLHPALVGALLLSRNLSRSRPVYSTAAACSSLELQPRYTLSSWLHPTSRFTPYSRSSASFVALGLVWSFPCLKACSRRPKGLNAVCSAGVGAQQPWAAAVLSSAWLHPCFPSPAPLASLWALVEHPLCHQDLALLGGQRRSQAAAAAPLPPAWPEDGAGTACTGTKGPHRASTTAKQQQKS